MFLQGKRKPKFWMQGMTLVAETYTVMKISEML
jgi:hypothetical protein